MRVFRIAQVAACVVSAGMAGASNAQDRQNVVFQINYNQTVVGQSVFVLGDVPELGGNNITKAVKLEPTQWPVWKATISLPTNTTYTYRFYRRDDGPGRLGDSSNQLAIGQPVTASTMTVPLSAQQKAILYQSGFEPPRLYWRTPTNPPGGGTFTQVEMVRAGPGRNANESRWLALDVGAGKKPVEFYFTSADGSVRDPALSATYLTSLDGILVQDGHVYSYVPAASVGTWRKDYNPSSPPSVFSSALGETRRYRVLLPRGYDQHTTRRYPVLYFHDGQNVFDVGPFGSWNAHTTAGSLTQQGQMREIIMVGADNGPNRIDDYAAPDAGGRADDYASFLINQLKPIIDAQYRTLSDRANTITAGSSMGGQVSMYLGWDHTPTFSRIGAFSGAWSVYTSGFYNRVMADTVKRDIRIYMDSGDAGASNDNYWPTFNLRDDLVSQVGAGTYALEGDLKHVIGLGQQHNEAAWAARLPDSFRFLVPAAEDQSVLLPLATHAAFDVDDSGAANVEDLYAAYGAGRDINLDGSVSAEDAALLEWYLRRGEASGMAAGRR